MFPVTSPFFTSLITSVFRLFISVCLAFSASTPAIFPSLLTAVELFVTVVIGVLILSILLSVLTAVELVVTVVIGVSILPSVLTVVELVVTLVIGLSILPSGIFPSPLPLV